MFFKSVIAFALILSHANGVDLEVDFMKYARVLGIYGDLSVCNRTYCDTPCPGAQPPAVCPDLVPNCMSGCACTFDCENNLTFCFETKDCLEKRLYLTGKKKKKQRVDKDKEFV